MLTEVAPRRSSFAFLVASAIAFVYAALPWPEGARPGYALLFALSVALTLVSARLGQGAVLSAALLTTFTSVACFIESRFLPWPASFAVPLLAYGLLVACVPSLRAAAPRIRRGSLRGATLLWMLGVVATSSGALVLWRWLLQPDLSDLDGMLPNQPLPWLLLGGLGFALLNALLEEAVFRVVFLEALRSVGPTWAAVVVQAIAFGALHLHGFPRGAVGVALATIYGLMLGALRVRAQGMLAVYLAHVCADLTIFAILLAWAHTG